MSLDDLVTVILVIGSYCAVSVEVGKVRAVDPGKGENVAGAHGQQVHFLQLAAAQQDLALGLLKGEEPRDIEETEDIEADRSLHPEELFGKMKRDLAGITGGDGKTATLIRHLFEVDHGLIGIAVFFTAPSVQFEGEVRYAHVDIEVADSHKLEGSHLRSYRCP